MSFGPTLLEAAFMNQEAYLDKEQAAPVLKGWHRVEVFEDSQNRLHRWVSEAGYTYVAVCGTRPSRQDILDSVKVFFGQTPDRRVAALNDYIRTSCKEALDHDRLALGGHSLGGLIASGSAAEFHLPALLQNAPGYFKKSPDVGRLDRVVEIRTSRDLVSDWGSNAPTLITLHDNEVAGWNLRLLHAVRRQHTLIQSDEELSSLELSSAQLFSRLDPDSDTSPTGNTFKSMVKSWRRLRNHQKALAQQAGQAIKDVLAGPRP